MKIILLALLVTLVLFAGCAQLISKPPNGTDAGTTPNIEVADSPPNPWDYKLETYPDGSHKWIRVNPVDTPRPANWPNEGTNPTMEISDSPPNPWDYKLVTYPDGSHEWVRVNPVDTPRPANWPNKGATP